MYSYAQVDCDVPPCAVRSTADYPRQLTTVLGPGGRRSLFIYFFYFGNLVKPSEMPKPLALTGITAHTQKHFTSSDKIQKKREKIYISDSELFNATIVKEH